MTNRTSASGAFNGAIRVDLRLAIGAGLAALLLAATGCSDVADDGAEASAPSSAGTAPAEGGKPELGTFGVELDARDLNTKPGDDFFMYASGSWYETFELPADKTRDGAFGKLADRSEAQVKAILDDLATQPDLSGEAKLVADFYNAYMDIDAINARGIEALRPVLARIDAISDRDGLAEAFGRAWLDGTASPIAARMGSNRTDPDAYQLSVGASGLGMPDRSYYLESGERFERYRTAYLAHIAQMLRFADVEDADAKARAILTLETRIADAQWPREKRRNRDLTLNQMARTELVDAFDGFSWDAYLEQTGYQAPQVNVTQPEPVADMATLIAQQPLETWQDYLRYHAISNHADLLSDEIRLANFDFYGRTLRGQQEPRPRWKRAIQQMSGTQSLGFPIGKVYVERHFPESSKAQMAELVANLRTALAERIEALDWMGEETKANALAKLASFRPKIGYPDVWRSVDGLEIGRDDLLGNVMAIRRFFRDDSVAREFETTDRERWGMVPQRVNAYYNSSFNEIVFPAAILQPPFFDPHADPAVNYGAIGAVIGHEIGHGFDDQGSKSDANGVQRNWWTDADRAAFDIRGDMLAAQYSAYEPIPGNFVNGRNSLGENIGDVGGMAMAYHAYKLSLNGEEAPVIDGLTGDQRFFLAWAQVWREKRTEDSMLSQLRAGTHAPGRYRALAPRNHDAWYAAFDVQPGDALYLPPEARVRIW